MKEIRNKGYIHRRQCGLEWGAAGTKTVEDKAELSLACGRNCKSHPLSHRNIDLH